MIRRLDCRNSVLEAYREVYSKAALEALEVLSSWCTASRGLGTLRHAYRGQSVSGRKDEVSRRLQRGTNGARAEIGQMIVADVNTNGSRSSRRRISRCWGGSSAMRHKRRGS